MNRTQTQPAIESTFRALSDRTRLRILNLLRQGELCVCDLVDILDVPQPTASRHLAYLRRTGLVQGRKEGLWHFYRLAPARNVFHRRLLECLAACSSLEADFVRDQLELGREGRRCCD